NAAAKTMSRDSRSALSRHECQMKDLHPHALVSRVPLRLYRSRLADTPPPGAAAVRWRLQHGANRPMVVCLIMDNPDTPTHPVIGTVLRQLSATHTVRLLDVHKLPGDEAIAREEAHPLAGLYLLKSHTRQALDLAHHLEQRGALVVNSWASSLACHDRAL